MLLKAVGGYCPNVGWNGRYDPSVKERSRTTGATDGEQQNIIGINIIERDRQTSKNDPINTVDEKAAALACVSRSSCERKLRTAVPVRLLILTEERVGCGHRAYQRSGADNVLAGVILRWTRTDNLSKLLAVTPY